MAGAKWLQAEHHVLTSQNYGNKTWRVNASQDYVVNCFNGGKNDNQIKNCFCLKFKLNQIKFTSNLN